MNKQTTVIQRAQEGQTVQRAISQINSLFWAIQLVGTLCVSLSLSLHRVSCPDLILIFCVRELWLQPSALHLTNGTTRPSFSARMNKNSYSWSFFSIDWLALQNDVRKKRITEIIIGKWRHGRRHEKREASRCSFLPLYLVAPKKTQQTQVGPTWGPPLPRHISTFYILPPRHLMRICRGVLS